MENDITIIFVSFHSDDIIEKSIATINHNVPIIVIENSRNFTLKEKLKKKYLNVKVIVPEKNLGNGAGINYGIKNIKTKQTIETYLHRRYSPLVSQTFNKY